MTSRPTIKTIAKDTGLSIATVSKALNGSKQVKEKTRDLILDSARKLGYELNLSGVQLRTGKTHQIAVLSTSVDPKLSEWTGVESDQFFSGISHSLKASAYRASLYQVNSYEDSMDMIRKIVVNGKADGIIISGTRPDDIRIKYLQENNFPFVTYGTSNSITPHAYVDADNERIVTICIERLIAKGHKRIGFLCPSDRLSYSQVRLRAYKDTLMRNNLDYCESLVAHGELTPAFGREKMFEMSSLENKPTAYICPNEATALGVLSGFHARGYVHGKDAIINATDDLNITQYFSPPLTTCYLPIFLPSQMIGQFMLRLIGGEAPQELQKLFMPDLIERSSDILG